MTNLTKPHKISALLLALLLLIACIKAAPSSQTADSTTVLEKKPLRYRLIALEPSVCMNQSVDLEFELENTSNQKVLIDPRALLTSVTIFHEVGARVTRADLWGNIPRDQLVSLEPGKYYRKTTSYPLHDKFFAAAGVYSIQATYGQFAHVSPEIPDLYRGSIESNTVLFELRDCE